MAQNPPDLHLAFDLGHSSIGWAVLRAQHKTAPEILGCGSVIFPADDCLASQRRGFRRQRRLIRATRLRIARIERLLAHLGVMTKVELEKRHTAAGGHAAPWLLSARVLRGGKLLAWEELWDVLRWYAHNRGYDGNKAWSAHEIKADKEDAEKVQNARSLYTKHSTHTMAETFCAVSGLDPLGSKISCNLPGDKRPKALNAAFPREDVEREVRAILERHSGILPKLDDAFIRALIEDWTALPCPEIVLPGRYRGGLLFGQLVPRFENRIIARCPITFERVYQSVLAKSRDSAKAKHEAEKLAKVPAKNCAEFLRFRWAMQVANIQIAKGNGRKTRSLSKDERGALDAKMRERGFFTPGEFKKAVREITGSAPDNLDQMLSHPDAEKALVLDPARRALSRTPWYTLFPLLPVAIQRRVIGQLRRGRTLTLATLVGESLPAVDKGITSLLDAANTNRKRGQSAITREDILAATVSCEPPTGRAPFCRAIMREAADFVFTTDRHPTEEGGPLYRSEAIRTAQLQRAIDEQTNNHLVRHRLLILDRLHRDILREYAADDSKRIARATIEVNRDLRELSGKTAKQIAQDFGQRLANFKSVTARLEKAFTGKGIRITPGIIRKARIAEDLGWTCPYTGKGYDEFDLLYRKVDKDHIIPRSERASDSLDSLVVTFAEVNKMKGKRAAARFVEDCQGQTVEGLPNVQIKAFANYSKDVNALDAFKGHDDDKRRKKRRKEMLLLRDYVEKEFTPRDLTQTSQLVRLGAQMLERTYSAQELKPVITSLPGSVTGAVRRSWDLLGCLATANPQVIDPDTREIRTKTEIRGITHLHHALDACVLALASLLIPRDGGVWELLVKRRLNPEDQKVLKERLGRCIEFNHDGEGRLVDLPPALKEQVRQRLAERRVVQHQPSDMSGLDSDQTVWRVFDPRDTHPNARRLARWLAEKRIAVPSEDARTALIICRKRKGIISDGAASGKVLRETETWTWVYDVKDKGALLGFAPNGYEDRAKLKALKAVKVLGDNFGIALDPEPTLIRPHRIWHQIEAVRAANGGKRPRIMRVGSIIQIAKRTPRSDYRGIWMVRGVQINQRAGYLVDLSPVDQISYRGVKGSFQNVSLKTIRECEVEILKTPFTGVATPLVWRAAQD